MAEPNKKKTQRELLAEALEKYGSKEAALEAFREEVKKIGYKGITEEMIPVVKKYGNIKDLSILIFMGYYDADREAVITEREVKTIHERIKKNPADHEEHLKYYYIYGAMRMERFLYKTGRQTYNFVMSAFKEDIITFEEAERLENYTNEIAPLIAEDKKSLFLEAVRKRVEEFEERGTYIRIDVQEQGSLKVDYTDQLEQMGIIAEVVERRLADYKAFICAVFDWAKQKGAEEFIPYECKQDRLEASYMTVPENVAERWFKEHLEELGDKATDRDRQVALLPYYDNLEPSTTRYKFMFDHLNLQYDKQRGIS